MADAAAEGHRSGISRFCLLRLLGVFRHWRFGGKKSGWKAWLAIVPVGDQGPVFCLKARTRVQPQRVFGTRAEGGFPDEAGEGCD